MLAASTLTWLVVAFFTGRGTPEMPGVAGLRLPIRDEAYYLAPSAILVLFLLGSVLFSLQQVRPAFDALGGHLPVAVQWLQAGNIRFMPYVTPLSVQGQYPANGELIDLWLTLPVHRDFLIQLAGLAGLGMTIAGVMMAVRELGGRWPSAIAWALVVPTLPKVFTELIGTNMDDLLLVGSVALMAAFVARHRRLGDTGSVVMAGLAMGMAVGTRYAGLVVVPPLVLVLAGQVLSRKPGPGRLAAQAAGAGGMVILAGGYWYARNLLITDDPVYPQDIPGHAVQATEKALFPLFRSYANLGFDPHDWIKGVEFLLQGYGPLALLLLGGALLPPVLTLTRRERDLPAVMWSLLPALGVLCFLFTPGGAGYQVGGQLVPGIQSHNLRYMLPILPYSAILLAVESSRLQLATERLIAGGLTAAAVVAVLYLGLYHPDLPAQFISAKMFVAATVIGVAALALVRRRPRPAVLLAGAAVVAVAFAALSPTIASRYDGLRTVAGMPYEDLRLKLGSNSSVAVAGFCRIYGLYGPELDRRVEYLTGADDQVNRPLAADYSSWLASLRSHHATAVVLATDNCFLDVPIPQSDWVRQHPEVFRPVYASSSGAIYEVLGT